MASRSIARADPYGPARLTIRVAWLLIALLLTLPLHGLWRLAQQPSPWPRLFLAMAARACGARVSVTGTPLGRDVFYVANHLSWIDIPIMGGMADMAFVAQAPLANWPVIGWLAKLNHTVFVSRTDRMTVGTQIGVLREAVARHRPVAIFPEGTTTDGRSLLPFKPSLFEVMLLPARPMMVQPVCLDFVDVGPEIAWIGEEGGDANALRVLQRKGSFAVRVHFLEPFDPGAHASRKAIAAEARARIAACLSASLGGLPIV